MNCNSPYPSVRILWTDRERDKPTRRDTQKRCNQGRQRERSTGNIISSYNYAIKRDRQTEKRQPERQLEIERVRQKEIEKEAERVKNEERQSESQS